MSTYKIERVSNLIVVNAIAQQLRQADIDEVLRMGYKSGFDAVMESVKASTEDCYIVIDNHTQSPFCIFGVCNQSTAPAPWLLCSDKIHKHKKSLLREAKPILNAFKEKYGRLSNYVSVNHDESIKFIHHLGFEFGEIADFNNHKFINFHMEA
tara:strand:+ start:111 stop:569 length:459 start_codon:yes stop_codon:yes gene_type:complete